MAGPGQISICPAEEQLPDSKVSLCDEDNTPESVVKICEDKCDDLAELTLSGPISVSNGATYQAGGGKPPYIYSITGGASISNNGATGIVSETSSGCGMGTVSVVDACGNRAEIGVRYPSGQWVMIDSKSCGAGAGTSTFTCFSDDGRYYYRGRTQMFDYCPTHGLCCKPLDCVDPDQTGETGYYTLQTYEWQCS